MHTIEIYTELYTQPAKSKRKIFGIRAFSRVCATSFAVSLHFHILEFYYFLTDKVLLRKESWSCDFWGVQPSQSIRLESVVTRRILYYLFLLFLLLILRTSFALCFSHGSLVTERILASYTSQFLLLDFDFSNSYFQLKVPF